MQLLYLVYGENKKYYHQAKFSILSALKFQNALKKNNIQITIITSLPEQFTNYPVNIISLSHKILQQWLTATGYPYRSKILALQMLAQKNPEKIAFIDADTYFINTPVKIFQRIQPQQATLFRKEYNIYRKKNIYYHSLKNQIIQSQQYHYQLTQRSQMWNSGIIGLHENHFALLNEILWLTDELTKKVRSHTLEQFAFAEVLRKKLQLCACYDVLKHYCRSGPARYFNEKLADFFQNYENLPLAQQINYAKNYKARRPWHRWLTDKI